MSPRSAVTELLGALAKVMPAWTNGWCLFDAQAVQVWGLPRLSADVDITASLRGDPSAFVSAMSAAGFDLRVAGVEDFVERTRVYPFVHRDTGIPVDVVLAGPGLEEGFLERAQPKDLGGVVVPVIGPEDLVVTKILAGCPKDVEDVKGILRERLEKLDVEHIRRLLDLLEQALGQSDLLPAFERELAAARHPRRP